MFDDKSFESITINNVLDEAGVFMEGQDEAQSFGGAIGSDFPIREASCEKLEIMIAAKIHSIKLTEPH